MSGCECKSGFFALRDCQEQVAARCPICRRAMCRRHAADAELSVCLDCAAGKRQRTGGAKPAPTREQRDNAYDDDWVYDRRYRTHGDSVYRGGTSTAVGTGVAAGGVHAAGFDEQDRRAFDDYEVERDDDDGSPRGFGDS